VFSKSSGRVGHLGGGVLITTASMVQEFVGKVSSVNHGI